MNERLQPDRNHTVFIHCPPEKEFREHVCALTLAVIASGHGVKGDFDPFDPCNPPLESLVEYISESRYSIHDCSLCHMSRNKASKFARYNLPIELGIAIAERYRLQRIHQKTHDNPFHEMFVFVKKKHAYQEILSGLIKIHEIYPYNSTLDVLKNAFQWLSNQKTSLPNPPRFEQVNQVWEIFQKKHPQYFQINEYGLNIDELSKYILTICTEQSWWEEPQWMKNQNIFDVFLAHNSKDKPDVLKIAGRLKNEFHLKPWIDSQQIAPGNSINNQIQNVISRCKSIAIFFSDNGLGNWQRQELAVAMSLCFAKETTVIPVLLPSFTDPSKLPLFIQTFRWVKFSSLNDDLAISDLIWGITGKRSYI